LLSLVTSYQLAHPECGKLIYCTRTVPEMEKVRGGRGARVEVQWRRGAASADLCVCMRDVKDKYTRVHLLSAFLRARDPIDKRERSETPQ